MPDADRRRLDPDLGERPDGQPDHLGVREGAGIAEPFQADLMELAEPIGPAGALVAECGPGVADPPRERRGRFGGRVGADHARPSVRVGGRPAGGAAVDREQLGDDPRAALPLVEFDRFEDRGRQAVVTSPGEAVEDRRFESRQAQ